LSTESRKFDHIRICLKEKVESGVKSSFEDIKLVHRCLPQIDFRDIELEADFLGRKLSSPIVIAAMTGGHEKALKINANLAEAAENFGIAIGVGSQRAAIEDKSFEYTYKVVREKAPNAFVIANLGAVQFCRGYTVKEAKRAVDMIEADAIALHLNPLQEAVQKEGDLNFSCCLETIEELSSELSVPLIVKETGAGIAMEEAMLIEKAGASAIDIGGLGGTSFAAVESYRVKDSNIAKTFWDWGIPTAVSLIECASSVSIPLIATGGLRSGIDAARAIASGASLTGFALPLLKPAVRSYKDVVIKIEEISNELKIAMFLTGSRNIYELKTAGFVLTGATGEWLNERKLKLKKV